MLVDDLKEKWLEALKSGKYKKGKGCLYDANDDSYCCLGVLFTVATGNEPPLYKSYLEDDFGLKLGNDFEEPVRPITGNLQAILAEINDENDTFEPVIEFIKRNV